MDRFLGVIAGAIPLPAYLSPANLLNVIGFRGMATVAGRKLYDAIRRRKTRRG